MYIKLKNTWQNVSVSESNTTRFHSQVGIFVKKTPKKGNILSPSFLCVRFRRHIPRTLQEKIQQLQILLHSKAFQKEKITEKRYEKRKYFPALSVTCVTASKYACLCNYLAREKWGG